MDTQVPTDWQQVHSITLRLLQGQQMQLKEMVQVRAPEEWIQRFSQQQDLCEKIEAQQMTLGREGEGARHPRMSPDDAIEAYLEAFERTATAAKWDPGSWVAQIGPFLIRPAQAAYRALNRVEARDYKKVKAAILYHLEISSETYSQKFRARKGPEGIQTQLLAQMLKDLAERWLPPETHTLQEVIDLIVLEQFLTDLSSSSQ